MNGLTYRLMPVVTTLMMSLWLASCSGGSQADAEGGDAAGEHAAMEAAGEHAEGGEAREGGEHTEGGEAREAGEHEGGEGGEHGGEHAEGSEHEGEHGGEAHDEEGEESGVYIGKAETWDVVRNGARLVMSFDSEANAFVGTVENTTAEKLCEIRVEVHLDSGTELGPTARVDLLAGQTTNVTLPTEGEAFLSFTAHPEMSPCGIS